MSMASHAPSHPTASHPEHAQPTAPAKQSSTANLRTFFSESTILMWKNPVHTGGVIGIFNTTVIFYYFLDVQFVPLICNVALFAMLAGGAAKFLVPSVSEQKPQWNKENAERYLEALSRRTDAAVTVVQNVAMWEKGEQSIYALIVLELTKHLSFWFSIEWLTLFFGNLMFIVPYCLYSTKGRAELDKRVMPHFQKFLAKKDDILAKIPKYQPKSD
uniref:Reticulon-like protein n=1 Tax=Noctiluca scintillans TaxID=2966 RepID=A0A7S1AK22_NOCSC|eukprot:CAMPEP_0194499560 /NCGR_PEP_ID=MMETSP0253-20130528/15832_1 /TAXON_ID=2966 /ORGANISM="Noctiluca scintillans" /LENGTH=215 /DNA_ID=CAMNT_0039341323 /DNA_START=40 /DNA_END=687 /DNA_ORIENTATION=+